LFAIFSVSLVCVCDLLAPLPAPAKSFTTRARDGYNAARSRCTMMKLSIRNLAEDLTMAKLSEDQIAEKLKALPGWEYKNNAISKMFKFKEFLHGIEFVQKVAEIAEAADHHPDIAINYTRVTFSCSTHDAGGVTDKDFKLAQNIEIAFKDRDE